MPTPYANDASFVARAALTDHSAASIHIAAPGDTQNTPVSDPMPTRSTASSKGGPAASPLAPHRAVLDDVIVPSLHSLLEAAARVRQGASARANVDHRDTALTLLKEHARLLAAANDTLAAVERLLVPPPSTTSAVARR